MKDLCDSPDLVDVLRPILSDAGLATDLAARTLASSDILPDASAVVPALVIRPNDTDATAACLRILAEHGRTVTPRGAGLSYTGGVVPQAPSVVVDTSAMTAIRIDVADLTAVVGVGCTWEALAAAKPRPFRPFRSGSGRPRLCRRAAPRRPRRSCASPSAT